MKVISTGRPKCLNDAAAKYGEHAPMAATCCNACRTCVQTNLIALGMAAIIGAGQPSRDSSAASTLADDSCEPTSFALLAHQLGTNC